MQGQGLVRIIDNHVSPFSHLCFHLFPQILHNVLYCQTIVVTHEVQYNSVRDQLHGMEWYIASHTCLCLSMTLYVGA